MLRDTEGGVRLEVKRLLEEILARKSPGTDSTVSKHLARSRKAVKGERKGYRLTPAYRSGWSQL